MTDDLTALRSLAENATPGPWEAKTWTHQFLDEYTYGVVEHDRGELWDSSGRNCTASAPDAKFIAASNPAMILALLDRLEQAEEQRDNAEKQVEIRSKDSTATRIARSNMRAVEEWVGTQEKLKSLTELVAKQERYIEELERVDGVGLLARAERAEVAIERVRELHAKHENTIHARPEWICSHRHCVDDAGDQNAWPCPTVAALDTGKETGE